MEIYATILKAQSSTHVQKVTCTLARLQSGLAANLAPSDEHHQLSRHEIEEWEAARPFKEIPGPKPLPLIGNSWRFSKYIGDWYGLDALQIQERCYEKYGQISTLGSLFGRQTVFICDPDNIEKLHRNEGVWPQRADSPSFIYYRTVTRKEMFENKLGAQVMQGKDWYDFRMKINPVMMSLKSAADFVPRVDIIGANLVHKIEHLLGSKQEGLMPDDFGNELAKFVLDGTTMIGLGIQSNCLAPNSDSKFLPFLDKFTEAFSLLYYMDILPPIWKYVPTPQWNRYVELLDDISMSVLKMVDDTVERVNKGPPKSDREKSLIEKFIDMDLDIAKVMALDMFIIGTDITSKTLGTAFYLLAKNPDVQEKLRNEMVRLLPTKDATITAEVLESAPYLKAVVKEVNRLAPVAIGNQRITVKDMVLCGHQIPKGTEVFTSSLILARMDKYFPQAKKFIPDRWLRTTEGELSYRNTSRFVTLPFGFGPRACIGRRFATLELEMGIAKVVRNFELSWPHEDAKFTTVFLHAIEDPLRIHMKKLDQ